MQFFSTVTFIAVILATVYAQRATIQTLRVSNGAGWGKWGGKSFCPIGTHAVGYELKLEQPIDGDDTALNNLRLICKGETGIDQTVQGIINSQTWGRWVGPRRCPNGQYLVAFKMRVEAYQGRGDDTAANSIQFSCRKFARGASRPLSISKEMSGFWGNWGGWSGQCPLKSAICGMEVRYETYLGSGDDTALNDVKLLCCS